jgi:hypothetical protein
MSISTLFNQPPKDLLIEIRVLQSCGTIMTENGPISLDKGSTNFLRRFYSFNLHVVVCLPITLIILIISGTINYVVIGVKWSN